MIEKKLQQAVSSLPEYSGSFDAVEVRAEEVHFRPRFRPRLALVCMLALLLVGCMSVTVPEYHLYNGNWWHFIPGVHFDPAKEFNTYGKQTMTAAEKLDITLPETLGGYPLIDFDRNNLTTKAVPLWYAWVNPDYLYFSSQYGYETEVPLPNSDGTEDMCYMKKGADLTYGPTDNEIWRRQFGFDENDVYIAGNYALADYEVLEITSQDYEGITIYTALIDTTFPNQDWLAWSVTWVDHDNGIVFSLDGWYDAPDDLVEYAKEIIDLNR